MKRKLPNGKEIVEIDLYQVYLLHELIKNAEEGTLFRLTSGILQSPGCNGDYGCCSKYFDIDQFLYEIIDQLKDDIKEVFEKEVFEE